MKKIVYTFFFFIISLSVFSQNDSVFKIDSASLFVGNYTIGYGISLNKFWKYHKGDNVEWAKPEFDDKNWMAISSVLNFDSIEKGSFEGIGWFRIKIEIDSSLIDKTLALMISHSGASEIYLDGKMIHHFGEMKSSNLKNENGFNPQGVPVDIIFSKNPYHVIAVKYSNYEAYEYYLKYNDHLRAGFSMKIGDFKQNMYHKYVNSNIGTGIFTFYFTFFIALGFLHLMFFLFYKENKSNLIYSIFAFSFGTTFMLLIISDHFFDVNTVFMARIILSYSVDVYSFFLLLLLYHLFYKKQPKIIWVWLIVFLVDMLFIFFHIHIQFFNFALFTILAIESFRVVIRALIKKIDGARIIGTGILITITFFVTFFILLSFGTINFDEQGWKGFLLAIIVVISTLSIPISMSILLARDFARTNKSLSKKLIEVEELSQKTILQEKEKQKILETQKEILAIQVEERLFEIVQQKKVIEEKNKDITESIEYAKTIQEAILPTNEFIKKIFHHSFVLYKPKDVVSGDFYWFAEKNDKKIIACCDCTGHGVPGAMMSIIGNNLLNQIINKFDITNTDEILNRLHLSIRETLNQSDESISKDGMDISLLVLDKDNKAMFSGANRPLIIIRGKELIIKKGNKLAVGGTHHEKIESFLKHDIDFLNGDLVYLFSDGFADQFNDIDEKLMTKRFYDLLTKIADKPMEEQHQYLYGFIVDWQGLQSQTDDILVIGIKIS